MLTHCYRTAITILVVIVATPCFAQPAPTATRPASTTPAAVLKRSKNDAAIQLLRQLRAIRDCWVDPYAMIPYEEPKQKSELGFYACGSEYALRLAEAQAAVTDALDSISIPAIIREANAAIAVFNDLDTLRKYFNRGTLSSLLINTRVSDVYPIIHKYNLSYAENRISKGEIYRQMMPFRRTHVDRLAALIPNAPADSNPTLTPQQAAAATDDLTWSRAVRDMSYEWYLRLYPQGRHAAEARESIARKSEIQKERNDQLERVRLELESITHKVLQAYVRGDKSTYGSFLSSRFPSRDIYIARLKPQGDVASFEINDFQVTRYNPDYELYRATMSVHYTSIFNKQRDYRNSILYLKTDRGWEIVEWH